MTAKPSAARLDRADRDASDRVNGKRDSWWMRAIGAASDVGDQPQMRLLCAAIIVTGAFRKDRKLAATGAKMLAAHTVATWGKGRVKAVIDRTRPSSRHNGYRFGRGDSDAHGENAFPSGHSAGAWAVAQAFARSYPDHAFAARTAAGAVAVAQIARGEHFIGDVLVGSLLGIAAERSTSAVVTNRRPTPNREGYAPFTVAAAPAAAGRTPPSLK